MQITFLYTVIGVAIAGTLGAGSVMLYNPEPAEQHRLTGIVTARVTQNAVAAERYRQAFGGSAAVAAVTNLSGQVAPYGGDFSGIGLDGEAWTLGTVGASPALCFSATESARSSAVLQKALSRVNRGFVSSQCGVVGAPASGQVVFTVPLQGAS